MSQKQFELKGIVRNLPDNSVLDGSMQEVINLRPKDGAWRPIGLKLKEESFPQNVIFIHQINNTTKVYWGYLDTGYLAFWVYINNNLVTFNTTFISIAVGKSIECIALGNTVIIANHTDKVNTLLGYLFDITSYQNYGSGIPDLPEFSMTNIPKTSKLYVTANTKESRLAEGLKAMNENGSSETKGYATGKILVRFAWELTDGSIIKPSAPFMIDLSFLSYGTSTQISFYPGELNINVVTPTIQLTDIKNIYKGLIASLNIYTCRLQEMKEGIISQYYMPIQNDPSLEDEINYYKLASIPLSDIDDGISLVNKGFYGPFFNMEGRETMPTDSFTYHNIYAKSLFGYNSRIFMGDVSTVLSNFPHAVNTFGNTEELFTGTSFEVALEFDIYTRLGTKTVFGGWRAINYYAGAWVDEVLVSNPPDPDYTIPGHYVASSVPVLCALNSPATGTAPAIIYYPDARAFQAKIFVRQAGVTHLVKTVLLKKNAVLNFAFNSTTAQALGPWNNYPVVSPTSNPVNYYDDNSRIQATEMENPFYYPAKNSYRVQGRVLGMSTNAIALSQGQFGQFPVYCFTSEGIWTMNIGDGNVLINTITPLSREVCNNANSITQIDGGTVFSTKKGLHIIQGTQVIEISQSAEGNYLGKISGTLNYEAITNNPNLYLVQDYLCKTSFLNYISGAMIAWDHSEDHKEIIVSNPAYKYSWVYNTIYKHWFKISQVFTTFVKDFPLTYGYNSSDPVCSRYTLSEEDYHEDTGYLVPVHMETRPIKLSLSTYKKINRTIIEGYINNNKEYPFSINVFGSPDKRNWYLLNSSNTFCARNQLVIGRATFSCTYYILVAGGRIDQEAYFTGVAVDFDDTYTNKLR